jgi:hypothetical protein
VTSATDVSVAQGDITTLQSDLGEVDSRLAEVETDLAIGHEVKVKSTSVNSFTTRVISHLNSNTAISQNVGVYEADTVKLLVQVVEGSNREVFEVLLTSDGAGNWVHTSYGILTIGTSPVAAVSVSGTATTATFAITPATAASTKIVVEATLLKDLD